MIKTMIRLKTRNLHTCTEFDQYLDVKPLKSSNTAQEEHVDLTATAIRGVRDVQTFPCDARMV